ncbi:MAG: type VI secretion protein IcmF/TssM N-terminal domain-containing protein [Planctomycetota bacterium]
MSSVLRSLLPAKARRWILIGGAVILLLGGLGMYGNRMATTAVVVGLGCVAIAGLIWLTFWALSRHRRKKRQRGFDADLTAREGIDDRKREWQSWVQELERRDIDRYELPFYLLVGEPQSGKSVLLQNSDLNFPFGQSKLSGVGGTRGCDWWFTEEAVVLDLAGRLLTQESGKADEAEWEAFLDLLNGYRPLDPANGIMLVIPCDSLLTDSLEECAKKASTAREALLSLTTKLEAKIPIYVVLTKGDKIFGFAETVHRLSLEERQQMFGWSRSSERLEEPFDPDELRSAWDGIVERSTALRDRMLSTTRLPEAQGEVDRMLGFPAELRGLYEPLETYFDRIFQGSDLVERLFFRGVYLTSGLQSGAPIAKVCLDILDRPGEADQRDLQAFGVRDRAYFIKDLVKRRVFAERGLVKPTSARVAKARSRARLAYGVAASLAVVSLIWGVLHLASDLEGRSVQATYTNAIASSRSVTDAGDGATIEGLLVALETTNEAIESPDPRLLQRTFAGRAPKFERLYESLYDERFYPALEAAALDSLASRYASGAIAGPSTYDEFVRDAEAARALDTGYGSADDVDALARLVPEELRQRILAAHAVRLERGPFERAPRPLSSVELANLNGHWDRLLDPADPLCVTGVLGVCLAREDLESFEGVVRGWIESPPRNEAGRADLYASCEREAKVLERALAPELGPSEATRASLADERADFEALVELRGAVDEDDRPSWTKQLGVVDPWLARVLPATGAGALAELSSLVGADSTGEPKADPFQELIDWQEQLRGRRATLEEALGPEFLGAGSTASVDAIPDQIRRANELTAVVGAPLTSAVALAKLEASAIELGESLEWTAFLPTEGAAATTPSIATAFGKVLAIENVVPQGDPEQPADDLQSLRDTLRRILVYGIDAMGTALPRDAGALDVDALEALADVRGALGSESDRETCDTVVRRHLSDVRTALALRWEQRAAAGHGRHGSIAPEVAATVLEQRAIVQAAFGEATAAVDEGDSAWIERTSSIVERDLVAAERRLRNHLAERAAVPADSDLGQALQHAEAFLEETSFEDWTAGACDHLGVPTHDDQELREFFGESTRTNLTAFDKYALMARPGSFSLDSPRRVMLAHVRGFAKRRSKEEPLADASLAAHFLKTQTEASPLAAFEDEAGAPGLELEACAVVLASFEAAVIRQLRASYAERLDKDIVRHGSQPLDALWHDVTTDGAVKANAHTELARLFGGSGRYVRLIEDFRVLQLERENLGFRASEGEPAWDALATDEERRLWRLDAFLWDMMLYLRGEDRAPEPTDDGTLPFMRLTGPTGFAVRIAPHPSATDDWLAWDSFTSPQFTQRKIRSIQRNDVVERMVELDRLEAWSFDNEVTFSLRWNGRDGRHATYESHSCLEPLLLHWANDRNDAQADVELRLEDSRGEAHSIRMHLSVYPRPPKRPDRPLSNDG